MNAVSNAAKTMLLGGLSAAAVAAGGGSVYLARQIAKPKGKTLAQERDWEIENGLWGDFDQTQRESYTVSGMDGYTLHCERILTDPQEICDPDAWLYIEPLRHREVHPHVPEAGIQLYHL